MARLQHPVSIILARQLLSLESIRSCWNPSGPQTQTSELSKHVRIKFSIFLVILTLSLFAASSAFGQAVVQVVPDNTDTGFSDSTPVAPVGGNNGTTRGEQRRIAVQTAATIWGQSLNSGPTITIRARWAARP